MRIYYFILACVVALTAIGTAIVVQLWQVRQPNTKVISQSIDEFIQDNSSREFLDLQKYYVSKEQKVLIQPLFKLSIEVHKASKKIFGEECQPVEFDRVGANKLTKQQIWEGSQCKSILALPANFFELAPYVHPSGESYAYLAYSMAPEKSVSESWLIRNIDKFHASEISKIKALPKKVPNEFKFLHRLSDSLVQLFIDREKIILNNDRVYMLASPSQVMYWVYPEEKFRQYMENIGFFYDQKLGQEKCFWEQSNICWRKDFTTLLMSVSKTSIAMLVGFGLTIIALIFLLLDKVRKEQKSSEKKRFALEVLAHELRTPVTNLLLQVERLNDKYGKIEDILQEDLPIFSSEIYRLQRIVEESKQYLGSTKDLELLKFKKNRITSLNNLVLNIIEEVDPRVEFYGLQEDAALHLDAYWFGLCLKNLIKNALEHGIQPVRVKILNLSKDMLSISVEDQGRCEQSKIPHIFEPNFKRDESQGFGLGLHLVRQILSEMGGDLMYRSNPTSFEMSFKRFQ